MATENNIQDELKEIGSMLAGAPVVNPYRLPAGYFETLPVEVMKRIKALDAATAEDEIAVLAPALKGLNKKPSFSVPEGYFEGLQAKTMAQISPKVPGKVISMPTRVVKYMAAAAVVGVLAAGAWFFSNGHNNIPVTVAQNTRVNFDKQMEAQAKGITDTEMINYLDSNQVGITSDLQAANQDIGLSDIPVLLGDVTDQELQHFLEHDDPRTQKLN